MLPSHINPITRAAQQSRTARLEHAIRWHGCIFPGASRDARPNRMRERGARLERGRDPRNRNGQDNPKLLFQGVAALTNSPKKQQIRQQKAIRIVESSESQIRVRYIRTQKIEGR